jgi:tetratricopeptide (TPR) repeat protein
MKTVHSRKRRRGFNRDRLWSASLSICPTVFLLVVTGCLVIAWTLAGAAPLPLTAAVAQEGKGKLLGQAEKSGALVDAETEIDSNRFDAAEPRLYHFLKDHPNSSRAYYDLGYVHFRTHKIGPSVQELSKSLELDPNNADAHKVLALNCSIIGRYDLAEVELVQAARLNPDSAEIHYFLARTYYTRGVYPLAKSEFEIAIRLDSSYVKAYSNLGITMEALGKTDDALKNYITAIQLEGQQKQQSEWPYIYLSAFYNRQKNPAEALNYARKALEVNPASDTVYFEMAKAYRTQKELQKAVDAARSAIAINSRVPDYYYVMGLVLRELGNQHESEEALERYAQLQQHPNDASPKLETQEPLLGPEQR